jgi:hypothetical protein
VLSTSKTHKSPVDRVANIDGHDCWAKKEIAAGNIGGSCRGGTGQEHKAGGQNSGHGMGMASVVHFHWSDCGKENKPNVAFPIVELIVLALA